VWDFQGKWHTDSQEGWDLPGRFGALTTAYLGLKVSLPSCPEWWKRMPKGNGSQSSV